VANDASIFVGLVNEMLEIVTFHAMLMIPARKLIHTHAHTLRIIVNPW